MSEAKSLTKDLGRKRLLHDENCVLRCYDLLMEWGTPFKEITCLVHLSSGLQCSDDIKNDMINAEEKGKEALRNFLAKRIESSDEDLFAPIQNMKPKTFAAMKIKTSRVIKDKSSTL